MLARYSLLFMFFSATAQAGQGGQAQQAPAVNEPVSAQRAALHLLGLLRAGKIKQAANAYVGFDSWRSISKRALDPAEHRNRHMAFLQSLMREFRHGMKVDKLELKDVLVLKKGRKLRKDVVMAVFHLHLAMPSVHGDKKFVMPMLFLQLDRDWKLMVRK